MMRHVMKTLLGLTALMVAVMRPPLAQEPVTLPGEGEIWVNGRIVRDLQLAFNLVADGGIVRFGPGVFETAGILKRNGVLIHGTSQTVLQGTAADNKAAIVVQADDVTIENIACRKITVPDGNGSCVRHEGGDLTLRKVHFHDNESGLLAWDRAGTILIEDSRFERNGKRGQAHAIYVNGGKLIVRRTFILSSKDQGHGIKSRAEETLIEKSVIASLLGDDSRLIDISDGGIVRIRENLLIEGPNSVNWQFIAFGVENAQRFATNQLSVVGNMVITDRPGGSEFILVGDTMPTPIVRGNMVVGNPKYDWPANNFFFESREELGLPSAPALPDWNPANP